MTDRVLSRRRFTATASAGLALPVLAACGDDSTVTDSSPSDSGSPSSSSPSSSSGGSSASGGFAQTGDVPVGGCKVYSDEQCVLTQPTEGDFKCFTSVCTHQGCEVSDGEGEIPCTCHGSAFSLEDGSVLDGPATAPLAEKSISVDGDTISLA